MGNSPWAKSIYAKPLQALVDRAQTSDRISWAVWGLTDLYRMELINLGDFSALSKLKDHRHSYIEVLNLKHQLLDELLNRRSGFRPTTWHGCKKSLPTSTLCAETLLSLPRGQTCGHHMDGGLA